MLIDWYTVAAQIINFLILVFLLKHFLYGRVVEAMDKREETIRSRKKEAQKLKDEAREERNKWQKKNEDLEEERGKRLRQAEKEADERRINLVGEAEDEVAKLKQRWKYTLKREKESFLTDLREKTSREVFQITRKTLKELADAELENRVVSVFLDKLNNLDEPDKRKFAQAESNPVLFSAFEIPDDMKKKIEDRFQDITGKKFDISFEINPDLIVGIEMKSNGKKVAWSVKEYLGSLEQQAREALEKETRDESSKEHADAIAE